MPPGVGSRTGLQLSAEVTCSATCLGRACLLSWQDAPSGVGWGGFAERQVVDGVRTEVCAQQKQSNDPRNNQHNPQYANYWAPLTRKRHTMPHSAQPQHANYWAPRTRKRHQQEHRPQRPTERSDPTQHAKGRTGDCPGPRKETATRPNVAQGGALHAIRLSISPKGTAHRDLLHFATGFELTDHLPNALAPLVNTINWGVSSFARNSTPMVCRGGGGGLGAGMYQNG